MQYRFSLVDLHNIAIMFRMRWVGSIPQSRSSVERIIIGKKRVGSSQYSVWAAGQGWTGALGLGSNVMVDKEWSHVSMEERENHFTQVVLESDVHCAASGWGHSILVTDNTIEMAGRPYEFSTLLRLHRLPSFLRTPVIRTTLEQKYSNKEQQQQSPSLWNKWIDTFLHASEHSDNEPYYPYSLLPEFTSIPKNEANFQHSTISQIQGSAGWSAIVTKEDGHVYACGVNHYGQCGQDAITTATVWKPTRIPNLPPISQISCGLQHGLALSKDDGTVYSWGKGERGQLGRELLGEGTRHYETPQPIPTDLLPSPVIELSCGLNHSACLTDDNRVWIWGKYTHPDNDRQDSMVPRSIDLLEDSKVQRISCGSHHTAILLENGSIYAVGITTDTVKPIMDQPVQLVPPGVISPNEILQFQSHFDRTTIVTSDHQVWEVQLMQPNNDNNNNVYFQPSWQNHLTEESNQLIQSVHRGWLHTLVLTQNKK